MWWSDMLDWLDDGVARPDMRAKKSFHTSVRKSRAYRGRDQRWYRRWVAPLLADLQRKARALETALCRAALCQSGVASHAGSHAFRTSSPIYVAATAQDDA